MDKDQVAEILVEIGILLELKGENPFKTRAYANVARTLETLKRTAGRIIAEDRLGGSKASGRRCRKDHRAGHHGEAGVLRRSKGVGAGGFAGDAANSRGWPEEVKALPDKLGIKSW